MNTRKLILLLSLCVISVASAQKYVGGDISLLPEYINANAKYYNYQGQSVSSPLQLFHDEGLNAMRVRLFVNPSDYTGSDKDPNACQDLEYVKSLGKQIKEAGFDLILDFHYSDTWADPAKQWTPAAWVSLTDEQLYDKIYEYTKDALTQMCDAGATPDFIQPGNEISYGMLWGAYNASASSLKKCYVNSSANWDRFTTLLENAIKACREVCPDAKVILHTERVQQTNVLSNFYTKMKNANIDYDIIGLSYYPAWHGNLATLESALNAMTTGFPDKDIMIVETGYSYAWAIPGTSFDYSSVYPYSDAGQNSYTVDLISLLNKYDNVKGLFWWWMEYNANGTSLSGWYNAPLFDSRTGRATAALSSLKTFKESSSIDNITTDRVENANDVWYTISGQRIKRPTEHGIYIHNGKKVAM